MPIRDDDDFDVIEGLSASRDDAGAGQAKRPAAQQTPSQSHMQARQATAQQPRSPSASAMQKSGRGFGWLTALLLLGLIVACGWLGQQVLQLQQQLSSNNNALQLERSRMESISAQVYETGSNFEETGNVVNSKFKFFESEIRKLWDVSNKRNKKSISGNSAQIKSLSAELKKSQQSLKSIGEGQSSVSKSVEKLNRRLVSENTALRATVDDQDEQILLMRGEMEMLQKRVTAMPNDLANRVTSNEEAVVAIDAGRRQLVTRITQLQKQVDALLQKNAAP